MTTGLPKGLVVFACVLLLAFGYWQVRLLEQETAPPPLQKRTPTSSKLATPPLMNGRPAPPRVASNPSTSSNSVSSFEWKTLETENYREYLDNLRAIGCPEETLRDIVAADLVSNFAPQRHAALAERYRDFKYWKSDLNDRAARDKLEEKRREIDQEMAWATRELLGQDYLPPATIQTWRAAELDMLLGFLPEEKRTPVRNVLVEFSDTEQSVKALTDFQLLDEPPEKLKRIMDDYDRKRETLRKLLTPGELQQVEMTTSWVSQELRRRLTGFNPTESEFKAIFTDWQDYAETTARMHSAGEIDRGDLDMWIREMTRTRLGEERAKEFWSNLK